MSGTEVLMPSNIVSSAMWYRAIAIAVVRYLLYSSRFVGLKVFNRKVSAGLRDRMSSSLHAISLMAISPALPPSWCERKRTDDKEEADSQRYQSCVQCHALVRIVLSLQGYKGHSL